VPPAQIFPSLAAAVASWNALPAGLTGVITIMDSETDSVPGVNIEIKEGSRLLIIAASWPKREDFTRPFGSFLPAGLRPHLMSDVVVRGTAPAGSDAVSSLFINGLLIEGAVRVDDGTLGSLAIQHSTLLAALSVTQGNDRLLITADRCIVQAIEVDVPIRGLEVTDSIVAAGVGSPSLSLLAPTTPCNLQSSSFARDVVTQTLSASSCLFTGQVSAIRRQEGCVRFSHVPPGSTTPRRYRCQPDLAIENELAEAGAAVTPAEAQVIRERVSSRIRPLFESLRYGDAGYGQLEARCPPELRTGAEDGAEMGAYQFLQQPQREANLRTALQEYLRFGLEARVFHVT